MKRLIALLLISAMIMTTIILCSCKNQKPDDNIVTDTQESNGIVIAENGVCNFNVVYPAGSFGPVYRIADEICNGINSRYGLSVKPITDDQEATANEILIGDTNRPETEEVKSLIGNRDYILTVINGKLVFYSKGNSGYDKLISKLFGEYAGEKLTVPSNLKLSYFVNGVINEDTGNTGDEISFNNGTTLHLDFDKMLAPSGLYGMGVVLQYNEEHYGRIIYSYGSGSTVFISDNEGKTFRKTKGFIDNTHWRGTTFNHFGMASMFELPVDMGDFPKGTVFECGNSINGPEGLESGVDNGSKTTIHIYYSLDAGESFTMLGYMDMERNLGLGVWEPYFVYEESTNRVYCFYSDDSDPDHDQKLVYKYSTDMIHWVGKDGTVDVTEYKTLKEDEYPDPFEAVACSDPSLRPGMPVITKMGNGEWFLIFEVWGPVKGRVHYKTTTRLDDWGDVSSYGTLLQTTDGRTLQTSPYCAWTPAGGDDGMLIVSARINYDKKDVSNHKSDIFISFDYGEHFTSIENPFDGTRQLENYYSLYHPVILFSPDGKYMYFFNNPANNSVSANEIRMARYSIETAD